MKISMYLLVQYQDTFGAYLPKHNIWIIAAMSVRRSRNKRLVAILPVKVRLHGETATHS